MCIIIWKPRKSTIVKRELKSAFNANSDGAGFCILRKEHLLINKGFFHFKDFWKAYHDFASEDVLIHFRIATSGGISHDNCHPFYISKKKNLILAHNGILNQFTPKPNSTLSDTRFFCNWISRLIDEYPRIYLNPEIQLMLESFIGTDRVFLWDNQGNTVILNERLGTWKDGVWYSNRYHTWQRKGKVKSYSTYYIGNDGKYKSNKKQKAQKLFPDYQRCDACDEMVSWHEIVRVTDDYYMCTDCMHVKKQQTANDTFINDDICSNCELLFPIKELVYDTEYQAYLCEVCYQTLNATTKERKQENESIK